ncbi:Acid phosphatase/vanadium-dependent haloperoxidase-related [Macleaya cordata]|uniref:Acid phosphatase/vanadium-dependent haloperoxidase-related n=1 Tax=Macleaya cordata TaxID=56857 RepID=A0A200QWW1_MACCD|nr:Acid phosphatase/vanadium-dependent haloperoxidase-related [Macleaya cordata]
MISYSSTSAAFTCLSLPKTLPLLAQSKKQNHFLIHNPSSSSLIRKSNTFVCLRIGVQDIAEIAHNKVLIAATVSAAIGQLSKPFTSALLYDNDIDFKQVIRAGGFPSTHSAGVVAAATSLGLERGFSDSIFGVAVVFAGIVMYDAQDPKCPTSAKYGIGRVYVQSWTPSPCKPVFRDESTGSY